MSATVITGKSSAQGSPVAGSSDFGPVEPMQPPSTFTQMTKKRSVSRGRPRPTTPLHQPDLPVTGWIPARYWPPVSAWHTRIALALGRASCRERVCLYVYISMVATSLQKQNEQH